MSLFFRLPRLRLEAGGHPRPHLHLQHAQDGHGPGPRRLGAGGEGQVLPQGQGRRLGGELQEQAERREVERRHRGEDQGDRHSLHHEIG